MLLFEFQIAFANIVKKKLSLSEGVRILLSEIFIASFQYYIEMQNFIQSL